jgi:hypothetical protein
VLDKKNANYFVIITPEKNNKWVIITKKEKTRLKSEVQREIYQGTSDMIIKKDSFMSTYVKKTYTTR